ncbi:hypothetical protein LWI29_032612 [Acer saccharum]|uniref:Uncharacterized protein n=1 Tax=Acer saccharum TaxID=4024 RepID=A0AA39S0H8_ACESA|nr:hypothetical protein LWI29_032612 [Acer saccharum]
MQRLVLVVVVVLALVSINRGRKVVRRCDIAGGARQLMDLGFFDSVVVHHSASSGPSSASVLSSTCISLSSPPSIVVGSIPIPLPDVPIIQQVCSLLPREASPPPSVVISLGGPIIESLSSLLPHEVSPPLIVVFSGGPIMESMPSGDLSKFVERPLWEHRISSS